LRSIQVAGARSAVGSTLPGRRVTGVAANHAVAGRSKSSAEAHRLGKSIAMAFDTIGIPVFTPT